MRSFPRFLSRRRYSSPPKRLHRFGALLLIVGIMGAMTGVSPAGATLPGGTVLDGSDGLLDAEAGLPGIDETNSVTDDSYKGGHENQLCPEVEDGSIPTNKSDLSKVYAAALEADNGNTFLYLAWERTDTNGTATMDFELNQSGEILDTCNGVNPTRQDGDILITYDFKGGKIDTIELRYWEGDDWGTAVDLLDSGFAEGSISTDLKFGELVVDLEGAGIFTEGDCVNFASVFVKSRASSAIDAAMKDLIEPITRTVTNCGSLLVTKSVVGGAGELFDFTVDCGDDVDLNGEETAGTDLTFSLAHNGSMPIPDIPLETSCTVTETVRGASANWTTTYLVTPGGSLQTGRVATVSVALGVRTVAFTNTRVTGDLTVQKNVSGGTGTFLFDVNCDPEGFDRTGLNPLSVVGGSTATISNIPTGTTCTVTERTDPTRWASAVVGTGTVLIDTDGETVVFNNTRLTGGLTISKTTNGGTGTFSFDVNCDGEEFDQVVEITDTGVETILGIPTGTSCTVIEGENDLFSSIVIPDTGTVRIDLNGETVAFTNNRNTGPLTITKTAIGGSGTFLFDVNCTDNAFDQVVTIIGNDSKTILNIPTTTSCTVTERANPLFTSSVDPSAGTVVVGAGGANVAFINTAKSNGITVDKKVNGGDHATAGDALLAHNSDVLTYTVVITNNGQVPLTITALSDSLYAEFAAACPQGIGSVLLAGTSITCTYQVSGGRDAHNVVSVIAIDGFERPVSDTDETFVDVINPGISIVKTANPVSVAAPSGTVTFTYVVTNTGDITLSDVLVIDNVIGAIGRTGTLGAGESVTFTVTVTVDVDTPLTNIGTVEGTDVLGRTVTDEDSFTISFVAGKVLVAPAELPRTGAPIQGMLYATLTLVGVGFVLLVAGRRRQRL